MKRCYKVSKNIYCPTINKLTCKNPILRLILVPDPKGEGLVAMTFKCR